MFKGCYNSHQTVNMELKENLRLEKRADVFGELLWDYYKNGLGYLILERDDGYIIAGSASVYLSEYKAWEDSTKKALKKIKGKTLDIGCGAGRHTLYLQSQGIDVMGIDNSPLCVKICKERGLKKAQVLSIEQIGQLKVEYFNTIILFGDNFGLFGSSQKAQKILKNIYKITSEDAIIIVETKDLYKTDIPEHLEYQKNNLKNNKLGGQIRMRLRYKKLASPWFDFLYVSSEELEQIIKDTGWKIREYINDLDQGSRYIAILEKNK